jgi:ribosome-binding protein aMBF1 (putative translation factor)
VNLLLEREQIVVWDEEGKVIALHPTHRDEYIPGTNLWRSQRRIVLDEMRRQLLQFRDRHIADEQSFETTLQKAGALYAQQLRRGQLAGDTREEAIVELLALADVLFDPARLASLFGIDEAEVRAAAARHLQPTPPATPMKRRQPKRLTPSEESDTTPETQRESSGVERESDGAQRESTETQRESMDELDLRRERMARGLSQRQLAQLLGISDSAISRRELGVCDIEPELLSDLRRVFAKHPVPNGQTSQ